MLCFTFFYTCFTFYFLYFTFSYIFYFTFTYIFCFTFLFQRINIKKNTFVKDYVTPSNSWKHKHMTWCLHWRVYPLRKWKSSKIMQDESNTQISAACHVSGTPRSLDMKNNFQQILIIDYLVTLLWVVVNGRIKDNTVPKEKRQNSKQRSTKYYIGN